MSWGNTKGRQIELERKREKIVFTADQIAEATILRSKGMGWRNIGRHVGLTEWQVMRIVDPDYAERRKKYWAKKNSLENGGGSRGPLGDRLAPPAAYLIADRDRRLYEKPQSIGQAMFGDPPPGQSALDKLRSPWAGK